MGKRLYQGFSMAEVLIVIAIIGVLAAVGAPNVISLQASLRTAELDAKAEQVYNAAQYRLASMKTGGMLASSAGVPALDAFSSLAKVRPADYSQAAAAGASANVHAGADGIVFAAKGSAAADAYLVPTDAAAVTRGVTDGNFVVEFNPLTGEAYAVFYWEDDAREAAGAVPQNCEAYYLAVRDDRTDKRKLEDERVGYYRGGDVGDLVERGSGGDAGSGDEGKSFDIGESAVDIVNDEELYVRIANPTLNAPDFDPSKLKVLINVKTTNQYSLQDVDLNVDILLGGDEVGYSPGDVEVDYILDSMFPDENGRVMSFKNLLADRGYSVRSGAAADITVTVSYDGDEWGSATTRVNTAFGDVYMRLLDLQDDHEDWRLAQDGATVVDGAGNPIGYTIDDEGYVLDADGNRMMLQDKINISSLRHLLNLTDADFEWGTSSYKTVALAGDIDFNGLKWAKTSVATGAHRSRTNLNPYYDDAEADYDPIDPIELNSSFNNSNANVIDGRGFKIKNLRIKSDGDDTGLFEALSVRVKDIVIEDPIVEGGRNTGALAGRITNTGSTIENVTVTGGSVTGTVNVGGLVGYIDTEQVSNCMVHTDVSGQANVGGVVGYATNNTFTNVNQVCLAGDGAAGPELSSVTGTTSVGGFAGHMQGSSAVDCSACANVTGTTSVGGFVGSTLGSHGTGCLRCKVVGMYGSAGNVLAVPQVTGKGADVGGFVGTPGGGIPFNACIAAAEVRAEDAYSSACVNYGGFAGRSLEWPVFSGCYASGPVKAYARVGGFFGLIEAQNGIKDCYSTSTVQAMSDAGGFAGRIESSNWGWEHDYAYGKVEKLGSGSPDSSFGGFFGTRGAGISLENHFNTCAYLSMGGYNDDLNDDVYQAQAKSFSDLYSGTLDAAHSHPYSAALAGRAFPFAPTGTGGISLDHYGDWPEQG